jgi:hypothetical protein
MSDSLPKEEKVSARGRWLGDKLWWGHQRGKHQ